MSKTMSEFSSNLSYSSPKVSFDKILFLKLFEYGKVTNFSYTFERLKTIKFFIILGIFLFININGENKETDCSNPTGERETEVCALVSAIRFNEISINLADKNIRVNAIAPGYFWTALQPACWEKEKIPTLGADAPMKRAGETFEIAPLFVYLASDDSSYVTGQVMHINGGQYKG